MIPLKTLWSLGEFRFGAKKGLREPNNKGQGESNFRYFFDYELRQKNMNPNKRFVGAGPLRENIITRRGPLQTPPVESLLRASIILDLFE